MDSLVANYASDDEDGDSLPVLSKPAIAKTSSTPGLSWNRQSLLKSLPPPKSAAPESSSLWDDEYEPLKPPRSFKSIPLPKSAAPESSSLWDDEDEPLKPPRSFKSIPPPKSSAPESSSLWDDEDEPLKPPRSSRNVGENPGGTALATSFFSNLPPPRNSAQESSLWDDVDEPLRRPKRIAERDSDPNQAAPAKSFFASLPPPKIETLLGEPVNASARNPKFKPGDDDTAAKRHGGSLSSSLLTPKVEPAPLPLGFFDNVSSLAADDPSKEVSAAEVKPSSFFGRLPPPASSKPLFTKLPPPATAKPKQVVEFKPPINYALLESADDDDDFERSEKRSKTLKDNEKAADVNVGLGLMAFLPAPKNSLGVGAALGGGNAHGGRRTVMETVADPYSMAKEVTSTSGSIPKKAEKSEVNVERSAMGYSNNEYGFEPAVQSADDSYAQPDSSQAQPAYGPSYFGSDEYSGGNGYNEQSWQYPQSNAYGASNPQAQQYPQAYAYGAGNLAFQGQGSAPGQVPAEVTKKDRRKGRDEPPPQAQMIEVKQADLTGGSKLREDQMRSTGIAFGPAYKPAAASNKDKPSKIHRRKHQIGALYFDMKQNEMNLLDRRAKGNLTKAETQAKYGW